MGDMADYYLESADWFDDDDAHPPREVRCRDCSSEDVYWAQNNSGRWTLYDFKSSKRHVCNSKVVSERRLDAFDDES
jgi:hypothetical protein